MDSAELLQILNQEPEMNPDLHDGSYELMREIIRSYSTLSDFSVLNYKDLNAVYAMAIGTWKLNSEKKKEYVYGGNLSSYEKDRMKTVIDRVWDNACRNKYSNREGKGPSIGMFGTGFYSFEKNTDDASSQRFIRMMVDISNLDDDNAIFELADKVFDESFKGMQAAAASVMLHCLKPYTFPILNSNFGKGTVYWALGLDLDSPDRLRTYISNARMIKAFRDENMKVKNYRILDKFPHNHPEIKLDAIIRSEEKKKGGLPTMANNISKNTILYGPPGTGKTYNTIVYALSILENRTIEEISKEATDDYSAVKERYEDYVAKGRVAFTTFHQSYGYEEFIEGIKPTINDGENDVSYSIQNGVFKAFCKKASSPSSLDLKKLGINDDPAVWKVSLGGSHENSIRTECLENNHIRIGWDRYGEDISGRIDELESGKLVLGAFYNIMRIGDIVLSCYSATEIDAIGVIIGDCEWVDSYHSYKRVRKVKWLVKNIRENILEYNNGAVMAPATIYWMGVAPSDVVSILEKHHVKDITDNYNDENYVFIIDEINRGNISKIFGELITIIEETKRIGATESMKVKLPYSQAVFGVPDNVYILGTMNTADRSIAIMDTALRRRFSFVEMLPDSKVLRAIGADKVSADGKTINVADMLDVINERIAFLYDREHTIGHAFFTSLKDNPTIENLANIFEKSIVPLLQEYFYEDYGKIQLVLGDNGKTDPSKKQYQFIRDEEMQASGIFNDSPELDSTIKYTIQYDAFRKIDSYKLIDSKL